MVYLPVINVALKTNILSQNGHCICFIVFVVCLGAVGLDLTRAPQTQQTHGGEKQVLLVLSV